MDHNKKNLIHSIIFVVVGGILFFLSSSFIHNPNSNTGEIRWRGFYSLPENTLDMVFLGNSHMYTSVKPEIINAVLNVNSYALGLPSENISITEIEIIHLLSFQKPDYFIVETYALEKKASSDNRFLYSFWDSGKSLSKLPLVADFLIADDYLMLIPIIREHEVWKNPPSQFIKNARKNYLVRFSINKESLVKNFGSFTNSNSFTSKSNHFPMELERIHKLIPQENIEVLDEIVDRISSTNSSLLLFTSPQPTKKEIKNIQEYSEINEIPYIIVDNVEFSPFLFADGDHVNNFGSIYVTLNMIDELIKTYEFNFDQNMYTYYASYLFSTANISYQNSEVWFELVPLNLEKSDGLHYHFQIYKVESDNEYVEVQLPSSNQFIRSTKVRIPEASLGDEFRIIVQVNNPKGDFLLEGDFHITVDEER